MFVFQCPCYNPTSLRTLWVHAAASRVISYSDIKIRLFKTIVLGIQLSMLATWFDSTFTFLFELLWTQTSLMKDDGDSAFLVWDNQIQRGTLVTSYPPKSFAPANWCSLTKSMTKVCSCNTKALIFGSSKILRPLVTEGPGGPQLSTSPFAREGFRVWPTPDPLDPWWKKHRPYCFTGNGLLETHASTSWWAD